jgi:hypothetical protein
MVGSIGFSPEYERCTPGIPPVYTQGSDQWRRRLIMRGEAPGPSWAQS